MIYFQNAQDSNRNTKQIHAALQFCAVEYAWLRLHVAAEDTRFIPAALPPTEVIYFQNAKDSNNQTLDASTGANYTLTFQLPVPAAAFWSLTIYK